MRGIRNGQGEIKGTEIEILSSGLDRAVCDCKLGASPEMQPLRRLLSEQLPIESRSLKFEALRVLTPGNKEAPPLRIVGLLKKSIPLELIHCFLAGSQRTQSFVKVGCMVERVPLAKYCDRGRILIPVKKMRQVGMSLTPDIC
jgi:hypothetical protein